MSVMETDKEYSSADIGDMVGLKVSRSRQLLKKLVEMGSALMPLVDIMKIRYEDTCYNAAFLIKYQMLSDIENLKRLL